VIVDVMTGGAGIDNLLKESTNDSSE